jgi:hypothetical protein
MRWAEHIALMGEMRSTYKNVVDESESKRSHRKILKEEGWEELD